MNILRMQVTLPPVPGGMEQHVRQLTDMQRSFNHRVILLFAEGETSHKDDIKVFTPKPITDVKPQSLRSILFLAAALPEIIKSRNSIDIVHVHGDWSMAVIGWIVKKLTGARGLMLSIHGGPMSSRLRAWLQRMAFQLPDLLHATGRRDSTMIEQGLKRQVLWRASGISDIFLDALHHPRSISSNKPRLVVTTAVMRPMKNLDLVLDIACKMPEFHFAILGDGPERTRLQQRAAEEKILNLEFAGKCGHIEIKNWLDRADVFLCTSRIEGTPTAILEAMSRGVPVVTSDCGDFTGIVDAGVTGYVVDGYLTQSFVDAIHKVTCNKSSWEIMSQNSRRRADEFSWTHAASVITQYMENFCSAYDLKKKGEHP